MALYSKLDVVNRAIGLLGQLPVNDLTTPHPGVPVALHHLEMSNKTVQSKKWWFNLEKTTLIPQVGNLRILVPNDVAAVDAVEKKLNVGQRGRYLYNMDTGTYEFTAPVDVVLHRVVPFDELPPSAANYVMTQTLLRVQASIDGDGPRYRDLATEDAKAEATLHAENTRAAQTNLLDRHGVQVGMYRINQQSPFQYRR